MYYITNEKGWLIAADEAMLRRWDVPTIEALQTAVIRGEIRLPDGESAEIGGMHYRVERAALDSMLGSWYIVHLQESLSTTDETAETVERFDLIEEETEEELLEKLDLFEPDTSTEDAAEDTLAEPDTAETFETLDLLSDEETTPTSSTDKKEETEEENDELIDLLLPTEGESRVDTIEEEQTEAEAPTAEEKRSPSDESGFNLARNAEEIGVDIADYRLFLEEYLHTAQQMRTQLTTDDTALRHDAIDKLLHLANVLRLTEPARHLETMREEPSEEIATQFLTTVSSYLDKEVQESTGEFQPDTHEDAELFDLGIDVEETTIPEKETVSSEVYKYGPIDLSDVEPIHFDFTIEEAANDLSLPAELIGEFIQDFIKQAHEETERMIEAYRKGDLETVQKIGHLLKGTSSNLRITPLADTLYEIQFNDDIERVPELVRNYWGHFLSLENQMKLISQS